MYKYSYWIKGTCLLKTMTDEMNLSVNTTECHCLVFDPMILHVLLTVHAFACGWEQDRVCRRLGQAGRRG